MVPDLVKERFGRHPVGCVGLDKENPRKAPGRLDMVADAGLTGACIHQPLIVIAAGEADDMPMVAIHHPEDVVAEGNKPLLAHRVTRREVIGQRAGGDSVDRGGEALSRLP